MEQLYLLEVLVDILKFSNRIEQVPEKKDLVLPVAFSNLVHLDIQSDSLTGYLEKYDPFKREVNINAGKSYLFPSKPEELLKAVQVSHLQVSVINKKDDSIMGEVAIPWGPEFVDMIDKSKYNHDNVKPASVKNVYEISSPEGGEPVGTLELFIRLSCYGQSIQTQFQVVTRKTTAGGALPSQKYLFKSSNATATFQAQKFGSEEDAGSEAVPIGPIYNPADPNWKPQIVSPAELTADKINKMLCKNKDCPGVQKFKEFGLGPAATGKGLGTLYGEVNVPISYGLSHTYGSLENYGPYGVYTRPKRVDQPFIPKEPVDDENKSQEICMCGREIPRPACQCTTSHQENEQCCCCSNNPLRLSGGSPGEEDDKVPKPMLICKDLMQSFDKVLSEYKKALGPGGLTLCPFDPNITVDSCKMYCSNGVNETTKGLEELHLRAGGEELSACGVPGCPFSRQLGTATDRQFQQKQIKSACGSPSCPYTKRKIGAATSEDLLEMQLMDGPTIARTCGAPNCPIPVSPMTPPLEPIHWDCPDPLPKGPCRNPQCPYKPKELRYNITSKGPCGNASCPYATPPFCGEPECPFGPPVSCPYAEPTIPQCLPGRSAMPETCGGPDCPYSRPSCRPPPCSPPPCRNATYPFIPSSSPCGAPTCPYATPTLGPCGGPTCPFAIPPAISPCGAPTCPYANPPLGPCGSPDCKFAGETNQDDDICGNPDCPYVQQSYQKNEVCENPECPYAAKTKYPPPDGGDICPNPECPFVKQKPSPCYIPSQNICSNPQCPSAKPSPCYIPPKNICANPQCPSAKPSPCYIGPSSNDICSNPACPYAKLKPCFIPPKDSICNNPNCPYASQPCSPYVYPCKLNIGGTKVTVEYNLEGDTLKQQTGTGDGTTEYTSGDRSPSADIIPCSPRTCKALGTGTLVCGDCAPGLEGADSVRTMPCPCGGTLTIGAENEITATNGRGTSHSAPSLGSKPQRGLERTSVSEKGIKSGNAKGAKIGKKKGQYVYKLGDLYPGVNIGHRECIIPGRNVPAKMGWLWNVHVPCLGLKPRLGWRPGAVGRTIARRIIAHRKAKGLKLVESLSPKASKRKIKSKYSVQDSDSDATVSPKPTLLVKKREGCYYITMNPLKDPKTIEDNENPYMDCTPLQFKITKKKDELNDQKTCYCDGEEEEESSDSELDIEFTPPAGIIRPERLKKKKNVVHTDTQYNEIDFNPVKVDKSVGGKKGKGKDKKGGKGGKGKKGKKK